MKKLMKTLMIVGLSLTTLAGFSNANDSLELTNIIISFKDVKPGQQLFVKDAKGGIIHHEAITETGKYLKSFEFSNLSQGNYTIELDKDFEIKVIPFIVKYNKVVMQEQDSYIYFKPVVRNKENVVFVSRLTFGEDDMSVKIYFKELHSPADYSLIYSESIEDTNVIKRIYRLDKSQIGSYKIVTSSKNRTFIENFKI